MNGLANAKQEWNFLIRATMSAPTTQTFNVYVIQWCACDIFKIKFYPTPCPYRMKFQPDINASSNVIQSYQGQSVIVNGKSWTQNVWLSSSGMIEAWRPANFSELQASDFEILLSAHPEIILFGSGAKLKFPPLPCLKPAIERGIGVETMDSAAACRTYSVLSSEGRRVVVALLLE